MTRRKPGRPSRVPAAILAVLAEAHEPLSTLDVASLAGCADTTASRWLQRHARAGRIANVGERHRTAWVAL